jgi:uncharacterized membrane protein
MEDRQMKIGVWFYCLGTVLTGILNIAWGAFDASHQPIQSLGKNLPGQQIMAYVAGVSLVAAGVAIVWRRSARIGAAASAILYLIFIAFYLPRYYAGVHALGWRIDVLLGISFGLAQQVLLVAPAAIIFASTAPPDSRLQDKAGLTARWMLGLPPIFFGLLHIAGMRAFASIVPKWIPFANLWAVLTGVAFILAGIAICSGIKDVLALRLLALMLFLFEVLVEIPPIFSRLRDQPTWGAAVYNLTAIGACWIFAEFIASRGVGRRIAPAEPVATTRPNAAVA